MSTVINTNIAAIRTHNVYNRNDTAMNAALTRVATGMKINSAKDGASTWAISEKMRDRIRANDQANQNVQNDTALLKTAQGGIGNTIDILKTLKERAINASNDSNLNTDRDRIATEVEQLLKQIDDNATKVKFNGRNLLDGTGGTDTASTWTPSADSDSPTTTTVYATGTAPTAVANNATNKATAPVYQIATATLNGGTSTSTSIADNIAIKNLALTGDDGSGGTTYTSLGITEASKIFLTWKEEGSTDTKSASFTVGTKTIGDLSSASNWEGDSGLYVKFLTATTDTITTDGSTAVKDTATTPANITAPANGIYIVGANGKNITSLTVGIGTVASATDADGNVTNTITGNSSAQNALSPTALYKYEAAANSGSSSSTDLTFYIGGEANFGMTASIASMKVSDLFTGYDSGTFAKLFTDQGTASTTALDAINTALDTALNEQTKLGAMESRLGYASDNLVTMNENLEAADSVMRDSDIAKEMTTYLKYSVLAQASQYMLAQAGQNAFSVLNLLQA